MRIQNIADKINGLGGTCGISSRSREDNRYVVAVTGKLGVYQLEAIDYVSPSPLSTDADTSSISVRRDGDASWVVHRTINALDQLAPKGVM
ncbi:hypothetical protein OG496_12360 [Streptomyces sp. NBC_00988]|uniref:hypothetical protein n=1 Tax=Streptomyces sp. NBC_00988 TaxID=2903704 RepID=UPI00386C3232|nr:hypothetical protein OG496_12360 [Streptomyces sp. NBC_00988]